MTDTNPVVQAVLQAMEEKDYSKVPWSELDAYFMQVAIDTCSFSKDSSVQNCAIIDHSGFSTSAGINDMPNGINSDPSSEKWERPAKYLWVEHAERNAIYAAALHGLSTEGCSMYCPWASCADCARAIVQSGISKLFRLPMDFEAEGWSESIAIGEQILKAGQVTVIEMPLDMFVIPEGTRLGQFR